MFAWLSWQSTCMTHRRSAVRSRPRTPHVPVAEWIQAAGCNPVYVGSIPTGYSTQPERARIGASL